MKFLPYSLDPSPPSHHAISPSPQHLSILILSAITDNSTSLSGAHSTRHCPLYCRDYCRDYCTDYWRLLEIIVEINVEIVEITGDDWRSCRDYCREIIGDYSRDYTVGLGLCVPIHSAISFPLPPACTIPTVATAINS